MKGLKSSSGSSGGVGGPATGSTTRRGARADPAPVPRRLGRPRWLDVRILAGLLLVVAAVVIGAKVVGASSRTAAVWSAGQDLAVGTVLTGADVVAVQVNLADSTARYLAADPALVIGKALSVPVRAGELLPASALNPPPAGRVVVVPVSGDWLPPGVTHGSRVDIYLTTSGQGSAGRTTAALAKAVTVQSVNAPSGGTLSGASADYRLAVLVDAALAEEMVRKLPSGQAVITLVNG